MPPEMRLAILMDAHVSQDQKSLYTNVKVQVWWEDAHVHTFDLLGAQYIPNAWPFEVLTLESWASSAARSISRAVEDHLYRMVESGGLHTLHDVVREFELESSSAKD